MAELVTLHGTALRPSSPFQQIVSSIRQERLCAQALHRSPLVPIFLWSGSEASDTSQASRDY